MRYAGRRSGRRGARDPDRCRPGASGPVGPHGQLSRSRAGSARRLAGLSTSWSSTVRELLAPGPTLATILLASLALSVVLVVSLTPSTPARLTLAPKVPAVTPTAPVRPPLPWTPAEVHADGYWASWAILDRRTGQLWHSPDDRPTRSASMIKAWLAADALASDPVELARGAIVRAIRESDNQAASWLYDQLGRSRSIARLNELCGSQVEPGAGWGTTMLTAADAVLMGDCLARRAGKSWSWLRELMCSPVVGDFGPRDLLPVDVRPLVAIKNGWEPWSDTGWWTVHTLAVSGSWVVAVMTEFPRTSGGQWWMDDLLRGQTYVRDVAEQLYSPQWRASNVESIAETVGV